MRTTITHLTSLPNNWTIKFSDGIGVTYFDETGYPLLQHPYDNNAARTMAMEQYRVRNNKEIDTVDEKVAPYTSRWILEDGTLLLTEPWLYSARFRVGQGVIHNYIPYTVVSDYWDESSGNEHVITLRPTKKDNYGE